MRPGRIRPGNASRRAHILRGDQGFNEARADSPGKSASRIIAPNGVLGASMRPGRIRPGNLISRYPTSTPWPGFNEARADSPGKCLFSEWNRRSVPSASMRPGRIRPGNTRLQGGGEASKTLQ